jgi:hypothetical protein
MCFKIEKLKNSVFEKCLLNELFEIMFVTAKKIQTITLNHLTAYN